MISDEISRKYSDIEKEVLIKKVKHRSPRVQAKRDKLPYHLPSTAGKYIFAFQET